jgi:signal transduction histidine kinase
MALTEAELRRNGVTPQLRLADSLPSVMGDRIQLQQVLVNLVVNGVEAMSSLSDKAARADRRFPACAQLGKYAYKFHYGTNDFGIAGTYIWASVHH